jgi:hypothetical protein
LKKAARKIIELLAEKHRTIEPQLAKKLAKKHRPAKAVRKFLGVLG